MTDFSKCAFCQKPATVFIRQNVIPGKDFPAVPLCQTCGKRGKGQKPSPNNKP